MDNDDDKEQKEQSRLAAQTHTHTHVRTHAHTMQTGDANAPQEIQERYTVLMVAVRALSEREDVADLVFSLVLPGPSCVLIP